MPLHITINTGTPEMLQHSSTGASTPEQVLVVWAMIIAVFLGIWLLERYLKRREKRLPFSKLLTRRIRFTRRKKK
ncbi:hypothetical protein [Azonexus fungiphilus]|uniref:hypothetical protein n=1 Tax=Azonexus fungiphilus TaxID=146940 RepID=UPI00156B7121|nr:hypothetical protein [Azonexus fungiphilus]NHC08285.1 hypothetical protein [Azonexus fungiphilus]